MGSSQSKPQLCGWSQTSPALGSGLGQAASGTVHAHSGGSICPHRGHSEPPIQGLQTQRVPLGYQHSRLALSHALPSGAGESGQAFPSGGSSQLAGSGSTICHCPAEQVPLTRHCGRGSSPHAQCAEGKLVSSIQASLQALPFAGTDSGHSDPPDVPPEAPELPPAPLGPPPTAPEPPELAEVPPELPAVPPEPVVPSEVVAVPPDPPVVLAFPLVAVDGLVVVAVEAVSSASDLLSPPQDAHATAATSSGTLRRPGCRKSGDRDRMVLKCAIMSCLELGVAVG
jgi:hypothetical protein